MAYGRKAKRRHGEGRAKAQSTASELAGAAKAAGPSAAASVLPAAAASAPGMLRAEL